MNRLELFAQDHLFFTGWTIIQYIERRQGFPQYPDGHERPTKAERDDWGRRYWEAREGMPWVWRELYGFANWIAAMEGNISLLTVSAFWRTVYWPHPRLLFRLLFATLMILLFGTLWGPVYQCRLERWLKRAYAS